MEDAGGCSKQYRSSSSLYLMSALSMKYGAIIDHASGAPGNSKGVVDGLNAVVKRLLQTAMLRNIHPEEYSTSEGIIYSTMLIMLLMSQHHS
eukprot:13256464-Ditylum_brightwellii.AAC.1